MWRLGKSFCVAGGKKRSKILNEWKSSSWEFQVSKTELINSQLQEETSKRMKLESTIEQLNTEITDQKKLENEIAILKESNKNYENIMKESRKSHSSKKAWEECTRQQQHNRKKSMAHDIKVALHLCEDKGFKADLVQLQNVNTGNTEVLDVSTGSFSDKFWTVLVVV